MRINRPIILGSCRDICRTDSDPLGWWHDKKKGWRALRWLLVLLAVLLVVGLVVYFLVIDMKVMTPILTKSEEDRQLIDNLKAVISEESNDAVAALDGEGTLDISGITYHEGQYHVTRQPAVGATKPINASHQDFIEIVPAPDLAVQDDQADNGTESATALPLIRKGNRTSNKIGGNDSKVTPPARSPVYPTLPSSTSVLHDISEILLHNESESVCFSPHLSMCRGTLPYDLTTFPLVPGVSKLRDLDEALPYFEMIVESGCSARARQFVCSILEPECRPRGEVLLPPCHKACKAVAEECGEFILSTLDLSQVFQCDLYPDTDDPTKCVNWARGETCMGNEFRCPDGTCIPDRWQCDGTNDCIYAADEMNCKQCTNGEFRCDKDHKCISLLWQCDGQQDCSDGSDESNCPTQEECGPGQFQCEDESACIPTRWLCDGSNHCRDNSDEKNCSYTECHEEDFKCQDTSSCIPSMWRCNGISDCVDGSDEEGCTIIKTNHQLTAMPHTSPCPAGELRCLDGRCITLQQLCDGKQDCSDGADEVNCSING